MNIIGDLPKKWLEDELSLQKEKLKKLENNKTTFKNIIGFEKVVEMRKEIICIIEKKLSEL